jgi:hypothetical protein
MNLFTFAKLRKTSLFFAIIFAVYPQIAFAQVTDVPSELTQPQDLAVLKTSRDGTINVQISSNLPKEGLPLTINLKFSDAKTGNDLSNVNYDIIAMQNGEVVLSQLGLYTANGKTQHTTLPLSTNNQVDIIVILQGIGENAPYTGPQGETIETIIVPEFGMIAPVALILAISVMIIIQKTIPVKVTQLQLNYK